MTFSLPYVSLGSQILPGFTASMDLKLHLLAQLLRDGRPSHSLGGGADLGPVVWRYISLWILPSLGSSI